MKELRTLWLKYRLWRKRRYADSLMREAEHHRIDARQHDYYSRLFEDRAIQEKLNIAALQMIFK